MMDHPRTSLFIKEYPRRNVRRETMFVPRSYEDQQSKNVKNTDKFNMVSWIKKNIKFYFPLLV